MGWLDQRHECRLPFDEIPEERGWVGYWLCDDCGKQYRATCGEHGGRWHTPDGRSGPSKAMQRIK